VHMPVPAIGFSPLVDHLGWRYSRSNVGTRACETSCKGTRRSRKPSRTLLPPHDEPKRRKKMTSQALRDVEQNRQEILRLHTVWLNANHGLHTEGMREAFVDGDKFSGFNLNTHTYHEVEEWARLWEYLRNTVHLSLAVESTNVRVTVKGDIGWLTWEGWIKATLPDGSDLSGSGKMRGTEVYVREDATGNPVWKMWHCHYSFAAPEGEPRPGF
jgi:ketosteroid isomerase-like protein